MIPALLLGARLALPFLGRGALTTAAGAAAPAAITAGGAGTVAAATVGSGWGAAGAAASFAPGILSKLFLNARGGLSVAKTLGMGAAGVAAVDALDGESDVAADLVKDGVAGAAGFAAKTGGAVIEGGADAFKEIMDKTVVPAARENGLYAAVPVIAALKLLGGGGFLDAAKVIGVLTAVIKIAEQYGFKLPGVDLGGVSGEFNRAAVDLTNDEWTRKLDAPALEAKQRMAADLAM